jgi:hypothetical protein
MSSNSSYIQFLRQLTSIGNSIDFYFTWIMVPIGFATNIISISIFSSKKLLKTNNGFFNFLIAISNTFTLLFYFFVYKSVTVFQLDLFIQSPLACRFFMFIRRVSRGLSPTIESIMTLERFLSVYFPRRFPSFQNKVAE